MRSGHKDAQFMSAEIGRARGHQVRKAWSCDLPTDGVWLAEGWNLPFGDVPVAALEVVVSESPKTMKGSIDTLCEVSPAVGILMINDRDIRQNLIREGVSPDEVRTLLERKFQAAADRLLRCQQRILLWNFDTLYRHYRLFTGAAVFPSLERQL